MSTLISVRLWQQREGEIAMEMNHDKKSSEARGTIMLWQQGEGEIAMEMNHDKKSSAVENIYIPDEIWNNIMLFIDLEDRLIIGRVSVSFYQISKYPIIKAHLERVQYVKDEYEIKKDDFIYDVLVKTGFNYYEYEQLRHTYGRKYFTKVDKATFKWMDREIDQIWYEIYDNINLDEQILYEELGYTIQPCVRNLRF
jgi:predicted aspartyl protease